MRARLMALALLCINLLGFTLGPLVLALLAKLWPGQRAALAYGLAWLGGVSGVFGVLSVLLARRAVTTTRLLDDVDET